MSIGYCRPDSIAEAAALSAAGGRILAGGQSLMPLVNRGEVDAVDLIDINRLAGLDTIVMRDGFIELQRRSGHLGTVGCGVAALPNGAYQVVFSGLLEAPLPAPVVAAELARGGHDRSRIATALAHDLAGRTPRSDLHADAAYRLAVAPVLVGRVLAQLEAAT